MSKTIFVLNGPNLNLLGEREPAIYGTTTLSDIHRNCVARAARLGFEIDFRQTNFEGELIESVHQARSQACGIIINPAGYTFTSVALLDALKMFDGPKIELHISNVHAPGEHLSQFPHLPCCDRHHDWLRRPWLRTGDRGHGRYGKRCSHGHAATGGVMNYTLDFTPVIEGLPSLLTACLGTFTLAICGMLLATVIGIGGGRSPAIEDCPHALAGHRLRRIDPQHAVPRADLLHLFRPAPDWHTAGPNADRHHCARHQCGAYAIEIIRGGVQSISKGQMEAGLALGLHKGQVFRLIILKPALRAIFPR